MIMCALLLCVGLLDRYIDSQSILKVAFTYVLSFILIVKTECLMYRMSNLLTHTTLLCRVVTSCMQHFADTMAQTVYYSLFGLYPKSRELFDEEFKHKLVDMFSLWTTGDTLTQKAEFQPHIVLPCRSVDSMHNPQCRH